MGSVEREDDVRGIRDLGSVLAYRDWRPLPSLRRLGGLRETMRGEGGVLVASGNANTFRFVIRNMHRKGNLFGIRYRVWLRKDVPASEAISVDTFSDAELAQGERLLLPGGDDLPMVCFRLESAGAALNLVVTDKMGNREGSRPIDDDSARIMAEFSARARTWLLFKHEISRLYEIPQYRTLRGERRNVFREYLLPMQQSQERQMKSVSQYADEVTVTI